MDFIFFLLQLPRFVLIHPRARSSAFLCEWLLIMYNNKVFIQVTLFGFAVHDITAVVGRCLFCLYIQFQVGAVYLFFYDDSTDIMNVFAFCALNFFSSW